LQAAGYSADEYHSDLTQQARERLLGRFRNKQVLGSCHGYRGAGLDVDHMTHVINYDLPDSVETYVHRIGRTGRADKERRFLWFSRLSGVSSCKLNAMCAKSGKFFLPTRAQIEARQLEKASSGTGDFSWRASSVIFTDCARAE